MVLGMKQKVMIIGAGNGGTALIRLFHSSDVSEVVAVVDRNLRAMGIELAHSLRIPVSKEVDTFLLQHIDVIINATGEDELNTILQRTKGKHSVLIPGAVARIIFRLLEEKENLILQQEVQSQTLLEAIIHSSEEAISVVDEKGRGILINPAYTKITGLTEEEVIGKPATADIVEGESMHMKVLQTRKAVRGVRMTVGSANREVLVNAAPVIVNGIIKGSVGVVHDVSEIEQLTNELTRARQIIRTLETKYSFEDIIGSSKEMTSAIQQAKLAAKTPATVLLRGESGTGKELFAHAIHDGSERKFNKFVRVNCASLSESLLESELFGYEDGAFSGARRGGKKGLFEEANNGSILLDEIGELSPNMQAKLLRVLQENEIVRVGGTKAISIDTRVIAATHVNLEKAMVDGTFREDLYYRLNKLPIHIPPLRSRKDDIPALCLRLIGKINQEYGRNVKAISDEAFEYLQGYDYPGNVREIGNVLARAIIFMNYQDTIIEVEHLPPLHRVHVPQVIEEDLGENKTLEERVSAYEKKLLQQVLNKHKGNKTKTAKELGISIRSLYYKLERL
jgi:PAS domain S-box-containing protein